MASQKILLPISQKDEDGRMKISDILIDVSFIHGKHIRPWDEKDGSSPKKNNRSVICENLKKDGILIVAMSFEDLQAVLIKNNIIEIIKP